MSLYLHIPHPHRKPPEKVADQLPKATPYQRFNSWLAIKVTNAVGSMTCAYIFGLLALFSLPAVLSGFHAFAHTFPAWLIKASIIALVSWVAQTFLQLVLLSVIIVGQNIQAAASDKRAQDTYLDAEAVLREAHEIQAHLVVQDAALEALMGKLGIAIESLALERLKGQAVAPPAQP